MLKRVRVVGFRCFDDLELKPGPRQLVLGKNGTGKSSLLDAVYLLRAFILDGGRARDVFPDDCLSRWGGTALRFELDVDMEGLSFEYSIKLKPTEKFENNFAVRSETLNIGSIGSIAFANGHVEVTRKGSPPKQYPAEMEYSAVGGSLASEFLPKVVRFRQWLSKMMCVRPKPTDMRSFSSGLTAEPRISLVNLIAWYRSQTQDSRLRFKASLKEALPGLESTTLKNISTNRKALVFAFARNGQRVEFALDELSDGQRALVGLYATLHFGLKPGATVWIDEPENFVALAEIQPWLLEFLDKASEVGAQVVVLSHHPELIDQMVQENGIVLYRDNDRRIRAKTYKHPEENSIPASEYIARGWELGFTPLRRIHEE